MSSLTEQERLGLDEVFLSISSGHKNKPKFLILKKNLQALFTREKISKSFLNPVKALFRAQKRLKFSNFLHITPKNREKKKNLSK